MRSDDCTAPGCSTNTAWVVCGSGNTAGAAAARCGMRSAREAMACRSWAPMRPLQTTTQFSAVVRRWNATTASRVRRSYSASSEEMPKGMAGAEERLCEGFAGLDIDLVRSIARRCLRLAQ